MDASAYFRGKRITVMGLGLLGRGVGDVRYLAECGAELVVTDLKTREQLAESIAQLETFPSITFVLGEHRLEDFRDRDLILKAAGVPLDSPYIAEAKAHNIPVRMSADLFMELSGIPAVGVTGTRGKSTTTHMIAAILEAAGKKVLLGGNVRGVSTLALLPEVTPEHVAVLELDSWQCQGLGEARVAPHIAVFTTLYPDHLNYYKGDLDAYLADKANIFRFQNQDDVLVLGLQAAELVKSKYSGDIFSGMEVVSAADLPSDWVLAVPGEHNRYSGALALAAARAYGISDDVSRGALESFAGVPGRLEFLREVGGVKVYNDNNATTPEATLAALAALNDGHRKSIILIMGGADKGLDMSTLLAKISEVKKVVLLAGTGTERIKGELSEGMIYHTLSDAVSVAMSMTEPGDTLLFSPAFASFGMFKNEYERGDQFDDIVQSL